MSVAGILALSVALSACGGSGGASNSSRGHPAHTLFLQGPAKGNLDRLVALNTRTRRARTLPIMVGCGDANVCLLPIGGKLVIASGNTAVYDPQRPGQPRVRKIGNAWTIVPSASDERVWLAIRDRRKRSRATWPALKLRAVREKTVDGHLTQSASAAHDWWPGGAGHFPEAAVKKGLVFGTRGSLRIWSPRTQAATLRLPGRYPFAVGAHGDLLAWCTAGCPRLRITNTRTDRTRFVKPPTGYSLQPYEYEESGFSPKGSLLAVPAIPDREAGNPDSARWSIALVNVREGTARIVHGSRLDTYQVMAWLPSGKRLFFSAGGGRIMAYRPGARRATNFARLHGTIFHMAAL
ncbi:MAG: hypothetical protein ACRDMH_01215 [Solirubrobacterales bacterium]